jgi:PAS domain S-box-containing protein
MQAPAFAWGVGVALLATMMQASLRPWVGDRVPFLFFLPALVFVASTQGSVAALIVMLAGAASQIYWGEPSGVFGLAHAEDVVALGAYLVLGSLLVFYGGRLRLTDTRATLAEGRLALAQEGTGVGVFELDFEGQSAFVSPSLCEMLGKPVMQVPMPLDRWLAALDPEHVESSRQAWEDHAARGELRYEREQRIELTNGGVRWLLHRVRIDLAPSGSVSTARGTTVDITSRKKAEISLKELNESLEQQVLDRTRERDRTWNNALDLLLVVDSKGVFRATNPAWATVLGYRADELIGHGHLEFIHADDASSSAAALIQSSVESLRAFENRYRHKDGSYRWISWVASPEGDLIYANGRDVTADKEAAAQLEAAHAQLRQSQKMEAVGQLTGGVAHDFNNLLQVIAGNLQLLSKEVAGLDGAERRLTNALAATRRGAKLASQMLAFSRRHPLEPKITNIGRLVAAMDDLLRRALGGAIEFQTIVSDALWNARVDRLQLENAILNLAINSRDAMGGSGKLTIEVANAVLEEPERRPLNLAGTEYVAVAVTDTGHGMTADVMAKVFEPFFSTKPVGQGTGLGLSMVHGFVRQTGGQVRIHSVVGQGTTVTLYLPRSAQPEQVEILVDRRKLRVGSESVLVAEDEEAVREVIIEMLCDLGYRVLAASDAASALTIVESGTEIDLLLLDVVMPGALTSVELARRAKGLNPRLAVLFTSGYMPENVIRTHDFDAELELLGKPFTKEDLAAKVGRILENRQ